MSEIREFTEAERRRAGQERVRKWRSDMKKKGYRPLTIWVEFHVKGELDALAYRLGQDTGDTLRDAVRTLATKVDAGTSGLLRLDPTSQRIIESHVEERVLQRMGNAGVVAPQVLSTPAVAPAPPAPGRRQRQRPGTTPTPDGVKYVLGRLCPKAHDYEGTGQSLLYAKTRACFVCNRERKQKGKAQ